LRALAHLLLLLVVVLLLLFLLVPLLLLLLSCLASFQVRSWVFVILGLIRCREGLPRFAGGVVGPVQWAFSRPKRAGLGAVRPTKTRWVGWCLVYQSALGCWCLAPVAWRLLALRSAAPLAWGHRRASQLGAPQTLQGSEEAVIAWSAPQPYHQEAVPFINHALNHCFGRHTDGALKGQLKRWDFTHHDAHHTSRGRTPAQPGGVMGRHRREPLRLPPSAYNVPAN
jgi:transposase